MRPCRTQRTGRRRDRTGEKESRPQHHGSADSRSARGRAAWHCDVIGVHRRSTRPAAAGWGNHFPRRLRDPGSAGTRTRHRELCLFAHGPAGGKDFCFQAAAQLGVGLYWQPAGQRALCRAVLSFTDELWTVRWRRAGRTLSPGRAEEDSGLHGIRRQWMVHCAGSRHALQLDGHARSFAVAGLAIDDRESDSDVASDHDFFCARLRALHRKHVHHPDRDAAGAPVSFAKWWLWNQIPVTLGNIISASLFTGLPLFASYYSKPALPETQTARLDQASIDQPSEVAAAS